MKEPEDGFRSGRLVRRTVGAGARTGAAAGAGLGGDPGTHARPLYEAVYERLEVGPATSVLGLGCRSGLALLLAAARGAEVAGLEPSRRAAVAGPGRRCG